MAYFIKIKTNTEEFKINLDDVSFVEYDKTKNIVRVCFKHGTTIDFSSTDVEDIKDLFKKFPS